MPYVVILCSTKIKEPIVTVDGVPVKSVGELKKSDNGDTAIFSLEVSDAVLKAHATAAKAADDAKTANLGRLFESK